MGIPAVRGVRLAPQTPLLELIASGWGAAGVLGGTCIGFRRGSRRSWVGGTCHTSGGSYGAQNRRAAVVRPLWRAAVGPDSAYPRHDHGCVAPLIRCARSTAASVSRPSITARSNASTWLIP